MQFYFNQVKDKYISLIILFLKIIAGNYLFSNI